jgi:adenylate cyclase
MSGDQEQEYFSDGITEDIITDLGKVSALSIVSRNTAFSFKGMSKDIAHIARQTKAAYVLVGSVRKAGTRVRITAQLVAAANDAQIWGERYDRDLNDIFALQDEISKAIVAALRLTLLPEEKQALEQRSTTNSEAYKLYLMARQFWLLDNERYNEIVVRICHRVVEIDPNYAQAWATLALAQWNMFWRGDAGDDGEKAAAAALRLDPHLADSHAAMGAALRAKGEFEEGLKACREALRLEPNSYVAHRLAGLCLLGLRRYQDAVSHFDAAAAAMQTDFTAASFLSQSYKATGDTEKMKSSARMTLERIEKIVAAEPAHSRAIGIGACMLADLNERERAKEWVIRARLVDPENINLHYNLACAMVSLNETDLALETLAEVATRLSPGMLSWLEADTDLDSLRDEPRFKALMEQVTARLRNSTSAG